MQSLIELFYFIHLSVSVVFISMNGFQRLVSSSVLHYLQQPTSETIQHPPD